MSGALIWLSGFAFAASLKLFSERAEPWVVAFLFVTSGVCLLLAKEANYRAALSKEPGQS